MRLTLRSLGLLLFLCAAFPSFAARVWFVDNSRTPSGDGTASSPFATIAAAVEASAEGDVIFVFAGNAPYSGGVALKPGQALIGEAAPLEPALSRANISGVTAPPAGKPPVIVAAENAAVIAPARAFVSGVTLRSAAGAAFSGSADAALDSVTIDVAGAGDGILLRDQSGTFVLSHSTISGTGSGAAIRIVNGSGDVTLDATPIVRNAAMALAVSNRSGAIAFRNGSTIALTDAPDDAIALNKVDGAVSFGDAVTIATSANRPFLARDVKSLALTKGSIRGAKARGMELAKIGELALRNLELTDDAADNGVAAEECASDIVVKDVLRCNAALVLSDITKLTAEDVRIDGSGQLGMSGVRIGGAQLARVTIARAGNEIHEHAAVFRELTGDVQLTDVVIDHPNARGLYIVNGAGEARITIDRLRVSNSGANGQQGLLLTAFDGARADLTLRDSTFTDIASNGVYVLAEGSSRVSVRATGNTFERTGGGITLLADRSAALTFDVRRNRFTGTSGVPLNVNAGANSTTNNVSGVLAENSVAAMKCKTCSAIEVKAGGTATLAANINGNDVSGGGIWLQAASRARLNAAAQSNRIHDPAGSEMPAIRVQSGGSSADTAIVCARVGGSGALANQIAGAWDPRGAIQLVNRSSSVLRLPGLTAGTDAGLAGYAAARNGNAGVRVLRASTPRDDAFTGGEECAVPALR